MTIDQFPTPEPVPMSVGMQWWSECFEQWKNVMKPTVGISLSDLDATAEIFHLVRTLGMRPLLCAHANPSRWPLLIDAAGRDNIVCVVDDDPDMIVLATSLGIHAMVFQPPDYFSWHLVIHDTGEDTRAALAYRLKEWKDKHSATDQA